MARPHHSIDRKLAAMVKAKAKAEGRVCCLGGEKLNYDLPYRDPRTGRVNMDAVTVEHIVPYALGGALRCVSNLDVCCRKHNIANGTKIAKAARAAATTSRRW